MLISFWKRIGEPQQTAKDEHNHLAIIEEISWRKKSGFLRLKEGHNDTNVFICIENAGKNGENHQ